MEPVLKVARDPFVVNLRDTSYAEHCWYRLYVQMTSSLTLSRVRLSNHDTDTQ